MAEFELGVCVLADHDEDDHPQIQTDSPGIDGTEGTQPAERLMPYGLHGMPLDPDKGAENEVGLGAGVLTITMGDRRYAIPLQDPRDVGKVPKCRKGGAMLAGGAGDYRSFVSIDGKDPGGSLEAGSITIAASYSKDGAKKSLGLSFNVRTGGSEEIALVHGEGQRITLSASGSRGVVISSAGGDKYIEVGDDGNVIAGDAQVQGSLVVGEQLAALPVANGVAVASCFTALAALIAILPGGSPAPGIVAPFLPLILSKHLKST